jgi:hypothetical protein
LRNPPGRKTRRNIPRQRAGSVQGRYFKNGTVLFYFIIPGPCVSSYSRDIAGTDFAGHRISRHRIMENLPVKPDFRKKFPRSDPGSFLSDKSGPV